MQTKAFLVLTGVKIETYTTCIILKHIISQHYPYTYTFTPTHLLPPPKKTPQNKLQKKHFAKKCKNKLCRDALPPKTLPQKPMKQVTVHTTMHAQTTHTSQCNDMHLPRSHHPYIFPTTPTTICTMPPYSTPNTSYNTHNHPQP